MQTEDLPKMIIRKYPASWIGTWCYVVICRETQESIVIDPGGSPEEIVKMTEGTKPRYIVVTHRHRDHTTALPEVKAALQVPVGAHPADASQLPLPPDFALQDGDHLKVGRLAFRVIHTPGHTAGSVCLLQGQHLFVGDTIFPGGPGRTATPEDFEQIVATIASRIYTLPEHIIIHPGHGDDTTVGASKAEYAVFAARPRTPGLCGDVLWATS